MCSSCFPPQQTRGENADFALGSRLNKASGCRNYAVSVSIPSILKFNQTNGNNKVEHRPSLDLSRLTMSNHGREILKKEKWPQRWSLQQCRGVFMQHLRASQPTQTLLTTFYSITLFLKDCTQLCHICCSKTVLRTSWLEAPGKLKQLPLKLNN